MLKEKALEDERIKLADIIKFYNEQLLVLENLQNELNSLRESSISFNGTINPEMVNNFNLYASKVSNNILVQNENIKRIETDIEKQKNQVKKAYTEVKALEKLKENQKEKYNKELLLEDIKFIDDITTSRKRA